MVSRRRGAGPGSSKLTRNALDAGKQADVALMKTDRISRSCQRIMSDSPIWHHQDLWSVIMSFLDSIALVRLALTNHQFHSMAMEESVWRTLCLKHFDISDDVKPLFSWRSLYAAAVDGSHSYSLYECETHIDWMRIGLFSIESGEVIASDRLCDLKDPSHDERKEGHDKTFFAITNVMKGPWIADLHLVRCPVCHFQSCEGTMQTLEARHWELFLDNKYTAGDWKFEEVSSYTIPHHAPRAAAGIFDKTCFLSKETLDLLNLNSWISAPGDWQPRGKTSRNAAVSSTRLQQNDGLQVRIYVMRADSDGAAISIRISLQLV